MIFGPGYRVYYGHLERSKVILLLGGGSKASQMDDIMLAKERWRHFSAGEDKENAKEKSKKGSKKR